VNRARWAPALTGVRILFFVHRTIYLLQCGKGRIIGVQSNNELQGAG